MYPILHDLLSDRKGGEVFVCFSLWHWCFILLAVLAGANAALRMKKMDGQFRQRALNRWIGLAFGVYIADFFLMPLAYGEIDVEKLPFHVCTAMCAACFLSRHWAPLKSWRASLALLGFVSNLVYLIYPAGVMWQEVHPVSYRCVQTLSFHAIMAVYGGLALCFEAETLTWRKNLAVITAMTGWALFGNLLYGGYPRLFNWFFLVRDPFHILPEAIAPWVMPVVNVALFFGVEMLLCGLGRALRKRLENKKCDI